MARAQLLFCNPALCALTRRPAPTTWPSAGRPDAGCSPSRPTCCSSALGSMQPRPAQLARRDGADPRDGDDAAAGGGARSNPCPAAMASRWATWSRCSTSATTSGRLAARQHLEAVDATVHADGFAHGQRLRDSDDAQGPPAGPPEAPDALLAAILTNTSLAAMDIADGTLGAPVAPLLQELEASTQRAAALYALIRSFSGEGRRSVNSRAAARAARTARGGGLKASHASATSACAPGFIGRDVVQRRCERPSATRASPARARRSRRTPRPAPGWQLQALGDDARQHLPAAQVAQVAHIGVRGQQGRLRGRQGVASRA